MKKYILVAALTLLFACKKDNVSNSINTNNALLTVVKTKQNGQDIVLNENSYFDNGKIKTHISYKSYSLGLIGSKIDHIYENEKLVQTDIQTDFSSNSASVQYSYSRNTFEYNSSNFIIQRNNFLKSGNEYKLNSFTTYAYNAAGLLVKETGYTADGALYGYSTYTYDTNGNVKAAENYGINASNTTPVLALKYSYRYDTNKNPYKNVYCSIENIPFSVNTNNIVETVVINYNSEPSNPQGVKSIGQTSYLGYNNLGYLMSMSENGNEFTFEYK